MANRQQAGNAEDKAKLEGQAKKQGDAKKEKHSKPEGHTRPYLYALQIGAFAGLIWGVIKVAEHALKFTSIVPGFLLEPFYVHAYLGSWAGYGLGLLSFIGFSIVAALLYQISFSNLGGPWPGLLYGAGWWLAIYGLIGPLAGFTPPIHKLDWNSGLTDGCLFLLWGLFIGYSISLEFTDEQTREPQGSPG